MIGMILHHTRSGVTGTVDATAVHPDGAALARINDQWFMASELVAAGEVASMALN